MLIWLRVLETTILKIYDSFARDVSLLKSLATHTKWEKIGLQKYARVFVGVYLLLGKIAVGGRGGRWRKKNVTESVAYDVGFTMLAREFSEIEKDLNLTPFTNPCTTFSSDIRFPRKYERAR